MGTRSGVLWGGICEDINSRKGIRLCLADITSAVWGQEKVILRGRTGEAALIVTTGNTRGPVGKQSGF